MNEKRITKEYILDLITEYKVAVKKYSEAEKSLKLWEERIHLAKQNSRDDLVSAASRKADEIRADMTSLKQHIAETGREIRNARSELKGLETEPELSIDPDALLAGLESMGGTPDRLAEAFKEEETDEALRELKKELWAESERDSQQ